TNGPLKIEIYKTSGLAVACLTLGIIAILGCWIPVLNVISMILALVGLGLGIGASLSILRKKARGNGIAIVGGMLCIISLGTGIKVNLSAVKVIDEVLTEMESSIEQQVLETEPVSNEPRNVYDPRESKVNYDSEVSSAKKSYGKMIKEPGLEAAFVEKDTEVLVSKVRSVSVAENYGKERLRLSMSVKLPRKAISATDGKIEKAIAGSGTNVLGDAPWDKQIDVRRRLKEDGRTCEFKVHLLVPDEREKKLKEITGELEYLTASGTKKIDLGMMDFRAGVKSSKAGFSISKVGPSEWEEGSTTMSLKVDLQRGFLKSVKLYDENGEELDVSKSGTSYSGSRLLNLDFRARGQFPSKGRIVLDVWDNVKKHKVGFKALDISLGRDDPSVDEATGLL
ncbi:hypothetical protein LCGC14_2856820, partial [marine sediment metagenome]